MKEFGWVSRRDFVRLSFIGLALTSCKSKAAVFRPVFSPTIVEPTQKPNLFGGVETGPPVDICLSWPVQGPISSYFSASHPLGIDIDMQQDPQAIVKAAAPGGVLFSGGDPCCVYGYHVVLDHSAGIFTLYAHLSKLDLKEGMQVNCGDRLGIVGSTGYSTGPHVHFELRRVKKMEELEAARRDLAEKYDLTEGAKDFFYYYDPLDYLKGDGCEQK